MSQDYYQYIYKIHQNQLKIDHLNSELSGRSPRNPTLRKRFLLSISDALLGLGQRIRPAEFQVKVQVSQSAEGSLEINAEGC
jgi:hypothetical protein